MELRHLRYFVTVAEELNFSHAAKRLHVSQPPLSRQIRDLEAELGLPLFERKKNKVRLTEAGKFLCAEARRLLVQSDEFVEKARGLRATASDKLHIGYVANVHGPLVIETATRFRKAHPGVSVKVFDYSTAQQVEAILTGQIDLGFVGFREAPVQQALRVEAIGTTFAVLALPRGHRLAGPRRQMLGAFKEEHFITISEHSFPGARQYVVQCCAIAGFQPNIVREALHPIDVLNGVAVGEGVALVPEQMRRLPHQGVVFCEIMERLPRAESHVAWNDGRVTPVLLDFIAAAKATYALLTRRGIRGLSRVRAA